jgi:hypothetical protein
MEERSPRTIIARPPAPFALLVALALIAGGCIGRHAGPRTLAAIGGLVVGAGSATWAAGDSVEGSSASTTGRALTAGGFAAVAVGLAAIVAAGGWMAAAVACDADPDCPEEETCREVPAPPGGVPYKQCVPRS